MKDLGLKIAENKDVAFWTAYKQRMEEEIRGLKRNIEISEAMMEIADRKVKESKK